ncbi:MAG: hypothetical protein V8R40_07295 [Dysosmobacter sp.]
MDGFQNHKCRLLSGETGVKNALPNKQPGTLPHGKCLAERFAANGKPGNQRCDATDTSTNTLHIKRLLEPGHDHCAAVLPLTMPQMSPTTSLQTLDTRLALRSRISASFAPLFPVGRHGVKGLGIGGCDRYADDIKYDAKADKRHQDQNRDSYVPHRRACSPTPGSASPRRRWPGKTPVWANGTGRFHFYWLSALFSSFSKEGPSIKWTFPIRDTLGD